MDDMNDCTDDVCNPDGTTAHHPKQAGESCSKGMCNSIGLCVECLVASDCPGTDDVCQQRTCAGGACGVVHASADVPLPAQNAGDCKVIVCDGNGGTKTNNDDTDLPDDSNACTADACVMGMPANTNLPQGTTCTPAGGNTPLVCNDMGQCTGCGSSADCPGVDDECRVRTCVANVCGVSFTAAHTPVVEQTAGDCLEHVCDGAGQFVNIIDDADVPADDDLACTSETCAGGLPMHPNAADGSTCDDGNACTTGDACMAGACASGLPVTCLPAGSCHEAGVCDPMTGTCTNVPKPDGSSCDDGSECTTMDMCTAGVCSGVVTPNGTPCFQGGSMGSCQSGMCNLCGNGVVNPPEECDDLNAVTGDGCDACKIELTCAAGEMRLIALNNDPLPIPDTSTAVSSPVEVHVTGAVTRALAVVHSLTHASTADIDMSLVSPQPLSRELSTDNGSAGSNYTRTTFDDSASVSVDTITAPFTGKYRPEQSLTTVGAGYDFLRMNAFGTWNLRLVDDKMSDAGTLHAWSLALCVDPGASYCGDGVVNGDEECDDGNANNGDLCSNVCQHNEGCGDGNFDLGEECDDNNVLSGDGCSSTCKVELTCAPGETPVIVTNNMTAPVPEDGVFYDFPVHVATAGGVKKAVVVIGSIAHTNVQELSLQLKSPFGTVRRLSFAKGGSGDDYTSTFFEDAASVSIFSPAVTAPFNGKFQPQESLSKSFGVDFLNQAAVGTWALQVRDMYAPNFAVFNSWTLALCLGPSAYCGNGIVEAGEECDDGNTDPADACSNACTVYQGCGNGTIEAGEVCDDDNVVSGDGCSATCKVELNCDPGQSLVTTTSTFTTTLNDDNTFVNSYLNVNTAGGVKKAALVIGRLSHWRVEDLDIQLQSPVGTVRVLSDDNGGTGDNYVSTIFADAATSPISLGAPPAVAPFNDTFLPEQSLAMTAGVDFRDINAAGQWRLQIRDDTAGTSGTLYNWSLVLCLDTTTYCGNATTDPGEECDDGNISNSDGCTITCTFSDGCGDGNLDAGEQCDDDNLASGDGCSPTCQIEMACAPGETFVSASNSTVTNITDNNTFRSFPVTVALTGSVQKMLVSIGGITHPNVADLDIQLLGPNGTVRNLSDDNGGTGDHYTQTIFEDPATTLITAGTAPFTGRFRPEASMATTAGTDFLRKNAEGTWTLQVRDDTSTNAGTFRNWTLALCVDTAGYCGDGVINSGEECDDANTNNADACTNTCQLANGCGNGTWDAGEQCDDNNLASGDGCSSTCQVEIVCGANETPVIVSNNTTTPIVDNGPFQDFPVHVATTGGVKKVIAVVGNIAHIVDSHLDIQLVGPSGMVRNLSDDNGEANDDYTSTFFNDDAAISITAGAAPFNGTFRPEASLSAAPGTDFALQNAAGTWTLQVRDDTAVLGGTFNSWTLALCIDTAGYCGDGKADPGEECDDGNTNDLDACTTKCQLTDGCGDGNLDAGEQCDDNNRVSGDGCSSSCQYDITCAAGQVPVMLTNSTPLAIPDGTYTGAVQAIHVPEAGVVRKVITALDVTHPNVQELEISLISPYGVSHSVTGGAPGANMRSTIFSDDSSALISTGTPPFTGTFKPTQTLSSAAGFGTQTALGTWHLLVRDTEAGNTGTLDSWKLFLCIDPSVTTTCGNGYVEPGETCDDANAITGDGCNASCQLEFMCGPGDTLIIQKSTDGPFLLTAGSGYSESVINIASSGKVRKAAVVINSIAHTWTNDLSISLLSPSAKSLLLSSANGGSGSHYASTILADHATTSVNGATAPLRGMFMPEEPLFGLYNQTANGPWTLRVANFSVYSSGMLKSWTMSLCVR
ncbi:proprotein convertase P-domain-containing protein [Polyangium sorediatum]|uniref:Proprotein convertase P-domain-containing protein n=1 Tax=Polyangium sorediatum TaxID=889274 RepID=A0ABT6P1F9_9BACT|nr:proprotein convertase P-domain-containing protein [Polyangium sorediatum]MDI1434430.1 proprotein convertase P-domain-containing protein [Polyangium sorediatum]